MENNYMDKRIREMMENLDAEIQGGHWEQMESLLNDPANADLSENALDHELRNKLTEVEPEFAVGHWALLEHQLDAAFTTPEIEDVYLDGVTYEVMNDLHVPYNEEHWPIMQKRLEEEFSLRYKLIKYKVAELTLVALALFTMVQFLPLDKVSSFKFPMTQKTTPALEEISTPVASIKQVDNQKKTDSKEVKSIASSTTTLDNQDNLENIIASNSNNINSSTVTVFTTAIAEENNTPESSAQTPIVIDLLPQVESIPLSTISSKPYKGLASLNKENTTDLKNNNAIDDLLKEHLSIIPTIKGLELSPLASNQEDRIVDQLNTSNWKAPSFLRIGMVGAGDLNYVMTPYNEEYNREGTNQFEAGYGGGLTVGFKFGRWEIETGAMYANKSYNPDTINVTINTGNIVQGYEGIAWKGTQLDVLRIPLRARYNHSKAGKWQFYTQGGLAMNFTMNKIHSKEVIRLGPPPTSLRSPQSSTPVYRDVNENTGLLVDGVLSENNYLTVDLGFGIERLLSSRFSIFTQPTFHYQLFDSKIGYNGERLNNLSVEAGVRVSLKKAVEKK